MNIPTYINECSNCKTIFYNEGHTAFGPLLCYPCYKAVCNGIKYNLLKDMIKLKDLITDGILYENKYKFDS